MTSWLSTIQSVGTALIESTEQYAKDLTTQLAEGPKVISRSESQSPATPSQQPNQVPQNIANPLPAMLPISDSGFTETILISPESRSVISPSNQQLQNSVSSPSLLIATEDPDELVQKNQELRQTLDTLRQKAKTKISELQLELSTAQQNTEQLAKQHSERIDGLQKSLEEARSTSGAQQTQLRLLQSNLQRIELENRRLAEQLTAERAAKPAPVVPQSVPVNVVEMEELRKRLHAAEALLIDRDRQCEELNELAKQQTADVEAMEASLQSQALENQRMAMELKELRSHSAHETEERGQSELASVKQQLEASQQRHTEEMNRLTEANSRLHAELEQQQQKHLLHTEEMNRLTEANSRLHAELEQQQQKQQSDQLSDQAVTRLTEANNRLSSELDAVQTELARVREQQSTQLASALAEKDSAIEALERQVRDLHKTTAVIGKREQETQRLTADLAEERRRFESLERELQTANEQLSRLEREEQVLRSTLQAKETEFRTRQDLLAAEKQTLLSTVAEHETRATQAATVAQQLLETRKQLEQEQIVCAQHQRQVSDLKLQLEELNETGDSLATARQQLLQAEERLMAESQRQEQLAAQLDARQMDLAAAESQIHQLRSETDRVREEQATIVAQLERQQQQQREELSQQSAELRDAQAARQLLGAQLDEERASREKTLQRLSAVERALKAAEDRLIESNSQHESTIKRTAAELDKARATLGEKEAEISSLRQSLLQPAASATLSPREPGDQSTLTVAAASAAATAAAQAEFDRWRMEWMEKYRLVEQENLRLRDRSIRAERMLVDLQRQSGLDGNEMLAPTTMTGAGGGIPRTASQWMSGVTQLPWLESKEEDYLDSFAMGDIETAQQRTRRLAGNSAGASGLRIISVRRLKFMIRTAFREALRQVDVWSVQCGYWLRRQPLGRLLLVFYFVSIHLYLIIYGLSGSPTANLTAAAVAHPS